MTAPLMTLDELSLAVRQRADRVLQSGDYTDAFVTQDELYSFINQSLFELYDLMVARYESYYFLKRYGFITDGASDQFPLPSDLYKLLGVDLQIAANASGSNGYLTLRKFEMVDRNKYAYPNIQVVYGVLTNLRYKLAGNNLWLVPRAGAGQTLQIWYVPKLAPLVQEAEIFVATPHVGDSITIQVGLQTAVTFVAIASGTPTATQFVIGLTDTATAANLLAAILAYTPSLNLTSISDVDEGDTDTDPGKEISLGCSTSDPINWTSSAPTRLVLSKDRWSYLADGIGGWLEYVIVDSAIKMLQKEESDVAVFMAQKQALIKRIEEMATNRDAGAPSTVRDVQGSNPAFPGPGGGFGGGPYSGY